jgi:hypothetical protein
MEEGVSFPFPQWNPDKLEQSAQTSDVAFLKDSIQTQPFNRGFGRLIGNGSGRCDGRRRQPD